jgi:hypothetical protein
MAARGVLQYLRFAAGHQCFRFNAYGFSDLTILPAPLFINGTGARYRIAGIGLLELLDSAGKSVLAVPKAGGRMTPEIDAPIIRQ